LRSSLGKAARHTIKEKYAVTSNRGNFLNLFSPARLDEPGSRSVAV
jgi:hypothetical protein